MRLLVAAAVTAFALPASGQHHGGHGNHTEATAGITEAFVVDGLRIEPEAVPAGSAVGRAGLRFEDGGYVSVVYGKPYARGRQVFGGLVGYGQVWTTGAHRSTELWTTVPLTVGGQHLEPGGYSLFTTPGEEAWTVHLNRRLGAHLADEYDPAEDAVTVEVVPEPLPEVVEPLTLAFVTEASLGLRIAWDRTAVTLPFARADP